MLPIPRKEYSEGLSGVIRAARLLSKPKVIQAVLVGTEDPRPYVTARTLLGITFAKALQKGPVAEEIQMEHLTRWVWQKQSDNVFQWVVVSEEMKPIGASLIGTN